MAIITGVIGILLASASLGSAAITAMDNNSSMSIIDFITAGYNFLPSVLFFIGLATLTLGWAPKLGKSIYIYLAYSFVLNYFGAILDLPKWFSKTAIQTWIPLMPVDKFDGKVFVTITVISIVFIILGYVGYRKRDMIEGD